MKILGITLVILFAAMRLCSRFAANERDGSWAGRDAQSRFRRKVSV